MAFVLNRRIRACSTVLLCSAALTMGHHHVNAQTPQEPEAVVRHHVVNADDVYVRSGASQSYYPIGKVDQGKIVEVTGEKFNWARVRLDTPTFGHTFGYVKYPLTDQGRFNLAADGTSGRAMGSIRIYAPNLDLKHDVKGSWKWLVAVPAGTRLNVLETFETETDTVHKVALPAEAYGWISLGFLEPASSEQVRNYVAGLAGTLQKPQRPAAANTADRTANPDNATTRSQGNTPVAMPEPEITAATPPATTTPTIVSTVEPVDEKNATATRETVIGQGTTREIPVSQPVSAPEIPAQASPEADGTLETEVLTIGEGNEIDRPSSMDTAEKGGTGLRTTKMEPVREVSRAMKADAELQTLETAFERLKLESLDTAEVKPLRRLYVDLASQYADIRSISAFAAARGEQLEIWADLQARKQELRNLRSRVRSGNETVEAARIAVEAAGRYDAVGRLEASTIYTGQTLPRLFRLQDPGTGRTLAYLRPDEAPQLVGMLGQLIGVRGERNYDSGLRLNLIQHPRTLDLLTPQSVR